MDGYFVKDVLQQFEPPVMPNTLMLNLMPEEMVGQRSFFSSIGWPMLRVYVWTKPTTPIMVTGLYGKECKSERCALATDGAMVRFQKHQIHCQCSLRKRQPVKQALAAHEYGFYANEPGGDHPRWSRASERRLPTQFSIPTADPLPFNGYAEEVTDLYRGMDLRKFY